MSPILDDNKKEQQPQPSFDQVLVKDLAMVALVVAIVSLIVALVAFLR